MNRKKLWLFGRLLLVNAALVTVTGCETFKENSLTGRLWDRSDVRDFAEPAEDPQLELYFRKPNDVLVTYYEVREGSDGSHRRAYYISKNLDRIAENRKPAFANAEPDSQATAIDLITPGSTTNSVPFAIYKPGSRRFELVGIDGLNGSFDLPVYRTGSGTIACVALTPLTVVGDATIVGIAAAWIAGYAYASGQVHH